MAEELGITRERFDALSAEYRRSWPVRMAAASAEGVVRWTQPSGGVEDTPAWRQALAFALAESLRWGEPTVSYGPGRTLLWSVPLMVNMKVQGALVALLPEERLLPEDAGLPKLDVRRACATLRELAERENLTNAALLENRRQDYTREQQRADAIHSLKKDAPFSLRRLYLREEPDLLAAIRRGDRPAAREILNRILVALIQYGADRFELVKSLFLELAVTIGRTAVEAGGEPQAMLGPNYHDLARLAAVTTPEALAAWLTEVLDRVIESMVRSRRRSHGMLVASALAYMQEHLGEDLSRDAVAKALHVSPSHFSRLFKAEAGQAFGDALVRLRVNRAAELLTTTDRPVGLIALDCGFCDQSYFTKVFKRHLGQSPRQYRRRAGGG